MVGRFWQVVASQRWGVLACRVESKANIADGPIRDRLDEVEALVAQWSPPVLLRWLLNLWFEFGPVGNFACYHVC